MIATIASVNPGGVTLKFIGDEEPTKKVYKYIQSYSPQAGDKVLLNNENGTYVVIGKIVP
ncbi:hypothetical protein [Anaerorhabdus sp.]|uniref:hypothetical protein n=1 Tax=Anaerorhabdus sp. TaxID=1872524 RepID=UPI002FC827AD